MDIDAPVLDFLSQPENLPLAIEVSKYVEILKGNLHRTFWEEFNLKLSARVAKSEFRENWRFIPFPMRKLKTKWEKCYLRPADNPTAKHFLQMCIGQNSGEGKYTLYRGVIWSNVPQNWDDQRVAILKENLKSRSISRTDQWWLAWDFYKHQLEGTEFMLSITKDKDIAVDDVLDDFWTLFIDLRPLLEDINQAVANHV